MAEEHPERFSQFAVRVWDVKEGDVRETALQGIRHMEHFIKTIGLELNYQAEHADLEELARETAGVQGFVGGSFQVLRKKELMEIYKKILNPQDK